MSIFSSIAGKRVPKAKFNLSHERKMSIGMGDLIPTFVMDVLPNDKVSLKSQEIFARMSPMLAPIMHRVDVWTHYFFVPNRILWSGWEDFMTGGRTGLTTREVPTLRMGTAEKGYFVKGKLGDFLNIKPIEAQSVTDAQEVDSLPFKAYQQIFNDYYLEQSLAPPVPWDKDEDGTMSDLIVYDNLTSMRQRMYPKDYFSGALPWTQRGPEVSIQGDVKYKQSLGFADEGLNIPSADGSMQTASGDIVTGVSQPVVIDNIESLGITINELRNSNRLQQWLEAQARGGGRYIETILNHFGIMGDDSRLQRAEYLGGSRNPLSVSEVLNTTGLVDQQDGGNVQGAMAGHGVAVGLNNGFTRTFKEHGWVFGITSVVPKRNYTQQLPRNMQRFSKYDYYWPEFANLGEQPISNKELYFDETDSQENNDSTFGYIPRYAEYKSCQSTVHGEFRDSLDFWHLGEKFGTRPNLSTSFLYVRPSQRIFAKYDERTDFKVAGEDIYVNVANNVSAVRPMPYNSRPKL